jgi:Fuc2NAc and GlcNAc transferase
MGLLGAGVWWVFWGVSAVNVVNFMDGIDGLVGSQALIFGLHLAVLAGPTGGAGLFGSTLVGAAAGFLLWNWAPAKVFLGDAGSGGLGLAMVLGGALLMREREVGLIVAFLPLYPLFLDATITRLLRVLYGKGLMSAHRAHLYQRLANGGWGHARVTLLYAAAAASGVVIAVLPSDRSSEWAAMAGYAAVVLVVGLWLGQRVSSDSG